MTKLSIASGTHRKGPRVAGVKAGVPVRVAVAVAPVTVTAVEEIEAPGFRRIFNFT